MLSAEGMFMPGLVGRRGRMDCYDIESL